LIREEVIDVNPTSTLVSPKQKKRLPEFIEKQSTETLFKQVDFPTDWNGLTSSLMMEILYQTGVRRAELIGLREEHVDVHQCTIKVLGKGNKERIIPVGKELISHIVNYQQQKKEKSFKHHASNLLVLENGKALYPKWVYNTTQKYLSLITTIDKKSPHVLRHTFATHLLNRGTGLETLKDLLGHANLSATQVYTHNSFAQLTAVYAQAHPRGMQKTK
jgi:integrase/recombinase XerC